MPEIAIAILNYNGLPLLQKYLSSIVQYHPHHSVYVIDNQSTDNSVLWLKENFPQVQVVQNAFNYGFAKGYNEGLKHIQADYYVLMNNDIRITDNWLDPIVHWMEKNNDVAVCMPKLLDDKQPDRFEYAGACGGFLDILGYPFCKGRIFLSLEKDEGQYDEVSEIFWATGACMVVKSQVFWEAGGFDEDFFAHMEEIDLCWRIKNMGYKIYVYPSSKVYHLGGGTLHKINPQKTYLNFRNSLIALLKNHSPEYLFWKIFLRLILDGVAGIKFLLEGHGKHTLAVIKAHWYFYTHLKNTLEKRKKFQEKHGRLYSFYPTLNKSIVVYHYVLGVKKFSQIKKYMYESTGV
ncbi:MAG: glycosyltransferase family 2 protein [Bacteroidia bacterium]|nr:glycosyltransferase family 2 protein [Bacteroidia bacterium]